MVFDESVEVDKIVGKRFRRGKVNILIFYDIFLGRLSKAMENFCTKHVLITTVLHSIFVLNSGPVQNQVGGFYLQRQLMGSIGIHEI